MILIDEIKRQFNDIDLRIINLKKSVSFYSLQDKIKEMEKLTEDENFWKDLKNSKEVLKNIKILKNLYEELSLIDKNFEDMKEFTELYEIESDEYILNEIEDIFKNLLCTLDLKEIEILLDGEYDSNDCILTIRAGAGGTESQDWADMLYRMYSRYCNKKNYSIKLLDILQGDEAGIKSVSLLISGINAYGYLKSEGGVHRLVRISPFDSSGRRHTSFASVEVIPSFEDDSDIVISNEDLKIDTFRSGGAGGQHVNKTESAVRITHIPSGIVVSCQNQRSQHQNKEFAMKILKSKLIKIKEQQNLDKISDIKGVQKDNGWGSQIRSYIFMPYTLVKDHRTNFEVGNIESVIDGGIEDFITEYLKQKSLEKI